MTSKQSNSSKVSEREKIIERSWLFLEIISDIVSKLPLSKQNKILNIGKKLNNCGLRYLHVVELNNKGISNNRDVNNIKNNKKNQTIIAD